MQRARMAAVSILIALLLAGCGGGGDAPTPGSPGPSSTEPAPTAPTAPTPTTPTTPPVTAPAAATGDATPPAGDAGAEERRQQAMRLLGEMLAAYQAAPTLTDRVDVETLWGGQRLDPETVTMRMGPGKDVLIETKSDRITVLGDTLYFELLSTPDRYIEFPLEVDVLQTLQSKFRGYGGVMLQPALRYGRSLPEIVYNLKFGLPGRARISGYRRITDNDGRPFEQISLVSPDGSALVNVDPETKLIHAAYVEYEDPGAPIPNFQVARIMKFDPRVHDELPTPITFDPAGRLVAKSMRGLRGQVDEATLGELAVAVGDEAPDFSLFSLRGERWTLREHRDSVVVLVFWAVWNVESISNLKGLNEVAAWIEASGQPVEMVAVNTLRRGDPGESWEKALDQWERDEMRFPSLEDPDGKASDVYGIKGVPLTLIVDRAGRVAAIEPGLSEDSPARLTEAILAVTKGD